MDFNLSNEQELLRDGLTKFLSTRYDLEKSRSAAKTGAGWQPDIWRAFADELGILGATLPEEVGGIGGGPVELMVITEALGHALVVEPYVDTVVVAAGLLRRAGGLRATALLEKIAAGTAIVALAAGESESGERWQDVATTADRDGDGWILNGRKSVSMSAPLATHLLITATTPAGLSLFVVDVESAGTGLTLTGYRTVDDRRAADLVLDGLRVSDDALVGADGRAWPSLQQARDEGAAAICSEAVGCMRKVLADTVEYCKQRQQFGAPIGSFQVLQHRMVDMHIEVEQAVAAVLLAVLHLDDDPVVRARSVSAAKVTVGRAARFVGQQAVQLHGGMGMTEELAIGHYFKRLTAMQYEFGTTDHHIARYAELSRAT
ncbi:pimeloyl-CoA dehydrogenase small subunit [Mycolicibacterium moriokaense]|nr:pimeloyl-CoA dehydrogenase small subunit [Mycolicibacterium moriokaense]